MADAGVVNRVVGTAEQELVKFLVNKAMVKIIPALGKLGFLAGPIGWVLGIVVAIGVKYGDWGAYMLFNGWQNTADGKAYEEAANARAGLPPTATKEEVQRAKDLQRAAFDRLMDAS